MKFLDEGVRVVRIEGTGLDVDKVSDPIKLTNNVFDCRSRDQLRRYSFLRLSEADGACAREWVIGHVTDKPRRDITPFSNVIMMDMGSALHQWVQNSNLYFGKRLLGYWRCLACGATRRFGNRPLEPCEFCGASHQATVYKEYMFRVTHPYRVVGKIDAILRIEDRYRFGDIKTIGREDAKTPTGKDCAQIAGYVYFSQFDNSPMRLPIDIDRTCGYLFYFNKTMNFKAPVLTYRVSLTEPLVSVLKQKATEFTQGVDVGTLPQALIVCVNSSYTHTRAQHCPQAETCKDLQQKGASNIYEVLGIRR